MRSMCLLVLLVLAVSVACADVIPDRYANQNFARLVCFDPRSNVCLIWKPESGDYNAVEVNNIIGHLICGFSKTAPTLAGYTNVEIFNYEKDWTSVTRYCHYVRLVSRTKFTELQHTLNEVFRLRRDGYHGKFRGQTQSQYLSLDSDEGQAEAQSSADSSRAVVRGHNGMGQAQSQSIYDPSCNDCYSGKEPENLKERNLKDSSGQYLPVNKDAPTVSLHNLPNPQYSISSQSVPLHNQEGMEQGGLWPHASFPTHTYDGRNAPGGNSNPSRDDGGYNPSRGQSIRPYEQADLHAIRPYPYSTGDPLSRSEPRDSATATGFPGGNGRDKTTRDYVPNTQAAETARNPLQRYDHGVGRTYGGTGILQSNGQGRSSGGEYFPDNDNAAGNQGHHRLPEEKTIPGAETLPNEWRAPSGTNVNYGSNPVGLPFNGNQNHLNSVPLQNGQNTGTHQVKPESVPVLGTGVFTTGPDGQSYVCCMVNPSQYGPNGATRVQAQGKPNSNQYLPGGQGQYVPSEHGFYKPNSQGPYNVGNQDPNSPYNPGSNGLGTFGHDQSGSGVNPQYAPNSQVYYGSGTHGPQGIGGQGLYKPGASLIPTYLGGRDIPSTQNQYGQRPVSPPSNTEQYGGIIGQNFPSAQVPYGTGSQYPQNSLAPSNEGHQGSNQFKHEDGNINENPRYNPPQNIAQQGVGQGLNQPSIPHGSGQSIPYNYGHDQYLRPGMESDNNRPKLGGNVGPVTYPFTQGDRGFGNGGQRGTVPSEGQGQSIPYGNYPVHTVGGTGQIGTPLYKEQPQYGQGISGPHRPDASNSQPNNEYSSSGNHGYINPNINQYGHGTQFIPDSQGQLGINQQFDQNQIGNGGGKLPIAPSSQGSPGQHGYQQYTPDGINQAGYGGQPQVGSGNQGSIGPGQYNTGTYARPEQFGPRGVTDVAGTNVANQGEVHGGIPQNEFQSVPATDDSEAQASVSQQGNGTIANAASKGGNDKGHAQTQVQGTYTGSGTFSAQAQIDDETKGAESQVSGSKQGASGSAQGRGRNNKSQANVELGSETGSLTTHAQSDGPMHTSNSQVQGSVKGGMADAQARGPGSTSSQAQIGFTPYKEGENDHVKMKSPFVGTGSASSQSSGRNGQTQSQLQGTFKYGISYNGAAQAGSSIDKDAVFPNRLPFNKIDVYDKANKNINTSAENSDTSVNTTNVDNVNIDDTIDQSTEKDIGHSHDDHHKTGTQSPASNRRAFQHHHDNSNEVEYTTEKEDSPPIDYDADAGFSPDGPDMDQAESEYPIYEDFNRDSDATHQSIQSIHKKGLEVKQTNGGNTQHIVLGPLRDQDAEISQRNSEQFPDETKVYQPGEKVPGTGGYTIPIGFTGSVKSVSSRQKTYAYGSKDSPSQAQTVALSPGTGKIKYTYSKPTPKNINPKDLRSLNNEKKDGDKFVSISKSVTGALDFDNKVKKQYSHTYYTKSSSCGYFTFTCTIVSGSNGKKKICKPKMPTNPDGTPMEC